MGLTQVTAIGGESVSLSQMKLHLRVDGNGDDALIQSVTQGAREVCERFQHRQYTEATWRLTLDGFPGITPRPREIDARNNIRPPRPPLISITSITYVTASGVTATLATTVYRVDTDSEPARISLEDAQIWPTTRSVNDAVRITFVAGYGSTSSSVPGHVKAAIKLIGSELYEHREARMESGGRVRIEDNPTVKALLWSSRIVEAA